MNDNLSYFEYADLLTDTSTAMQICEILEVDSRRYNKAFTEENEAKNL